MRVVHWLWLAGSVVCLPCFADLPANAKALHEYDLISVRWDISFDFAAATISGDVTNTVSTTQAGPELVFDCASLTVTKVDIDGKPAEYRANGRVLEVDDPAATKGQTQKVRIRYKGAPEAGIYFVPAARAFPAHTDIVYTQGEMEDTRYWLPTYDDPDDKATLDGVIHVPAGWKALSNGRLVGVTHEGVTDAWHWELDQPVSTYLISMVAGPYDEVPDGTKPVPVSIWAPQGLDEWATAAFGGTDKIVQFYGKLTGVPYPWPKYSQAAVADFMFGGMENVTCTTQSIESLFPPEVASNHDSTNLVAHELAHQWFGDLVTLKDWPHVWLNEGFATFLPSLWDRQKYGEEQYDMDRLQTFEGGLGASLGSTNRSMIWTGYEEPIDVFDGFAYPGGASRLFMLMHQVGEQRFWAAITDYLNSYRYKNATTEDFFASMSKSLGVNLDEFRKQWFYTPGAPRLTVRRDGGRVVIEQGKQMFHIPVEFWLLDASGDIEKRHMDLPAAASTEIPNARGRLVLLDPEVWIMGDIHYDMDYSADDWKRLYKIAPNPAEEARLLPAVFSHLSASENVALYKAERSDSVRLLMLPRLSDNTELLLSETQSQNSRHREQAANFLANSSKSEATLSRLRDLWQNDPNPDVRKAALRGLLNLTNDDALAQKAWNTGSWDDGFRLAALSWWGENQPDKAREIAIAAVKGNASEPVTLASIRLLGRLKDKPGERTVYSLLASFLGERSVDRLTAAVNAIGEYGDKAAIPLLEKREHHSLHFVRRDVTRVIRELQAQ
jgi:aminopeptidase N